MQTLARHRTKLRILRPSCDDRLCPLVGSAESVDRSLSSPHSPVYTPSFGRRSAAMSPIFFPAKRSSHSLQSFGHLTIPESPVRRSNTLPVNTGLPKRCDSRTHARARARTHARTHANTHARMHTRTHAHTHARMHSDTRARTYTYTYTHTSRDDIRFNRCATV